MSVLKNSSALLFGSIAAQAIPLLALPLITRLYDPAAVGLQSLAIVWATAISVVATLRLDLAAVLPAGRQESERIVHAALSTTLIVIPLLAVVLALGAQIVLGLIGHPDAAFWLWLLPALSAAMAVTQIGSAIQIRTKAFKRLSMVNLANQGVTQAAALVIGVISPWLGGLVLARVLGQVAAIIVTLPGELWAMVRSWRPSWRDYRAVLRECRQFVLFNTPYSLVGTVARDAPVVIFGAISSAASVGLYGIARAVMFVPASLVSASLGPVFFKEAADHLGTPRLENLARQLLRLGMLVPIAAFALVLVRGPELFAAVFGQQWQVAGEYASLLAPAFWVVVQSSWIGRVFEVSGKQRRQLVFQLASDVVIIAGVTASTLLADGLWLPVAVFAVGTALQACSYFFLAAHAAGFRLRPLVLEWVAGAVAFTLVSGALAALAALPLPRDVSLWASVGCVIVVTAVVSAILARQLWRRSRPAPDDTDPRPAGGTPVEPE